MAVANLNTADFLKEGTNVTLSQTDRVITISATGGGGASALDDLTDVTITAPSNGQVLKYNGSAWVNDTDNTGGNVSDAAYDATTWNGDTTNAPSKNAVRDKIETLVTGPSSATDGAITLYDGTTGKLIKDSTKVLTTVGGNIAALANPSAVRWIRINADNTVTARTAAETLSDIGAQAAGSYLTSANIDDTAYDATSWNGVTTNAPSKNAVRDKIETLQPLDATLTALAGLSTGANKIPYSTGTDTFSQLDLDTDGTLAANSDTRIATQKAVKTYVETVTQNDFILAASIQLLLI
jgi:hypothetical protein